jgi:hypothetical protein
MAGFLDLECCFNKVQGFSRWVLAEAGQAGRTTASGDLGLGRRQAKAPNRLNLPVCQLPTLKTGRRSGFGREIDNAPNCETFRLKSSIMPSFSAHMIQNRTPTASILPVVELPWASKLAGGGVVVDGLDGRRKASMRQRRVGLSSSESFHPHHDPLKCRKSGLSLAQDGDCGVG